MRDKKMKDQEATYTSHIELTQQHVSMAVSSPRYGEAAGHAHLQFIFIVS